MTKTDCKASETTEQRAENTGRRAEARRWDDSELVMISAIEHWAYCERPCALIHL